MYCSDCACYNSHNLPMAEEFEYLICLFSLVKADLNSLFKSAVISDKMDLHAPVLHKYGLNH